MTPSQVFAQFLTYYYDTLLTEPDAEIIEQADHLFSEKAEALTIGTNGERRMSMLVGIPNPEDIDTFPVGPVTYEEDPETGNPRGIALVPVTLQFDASTTAERTFVLRQIESQWMIDWVEL